jgi:5'/3'-nucleotidase SurE
VRPLLLVTNDDGIESAGLWALADGLTQVADVVMCAPNRDYSGIGSAVARVDGMTGNVVVETIPVEGRTTHGGSLKAYALTAPPAACAWLGMEVLLERRPDLVISGINKGPNLGSDIVLSGTVGAVRVAHSIGISGLAVSTAYEEPDWRAAAQAAVAMARALLRQPLPEPLALNLNVPSGASAGPVALTLVSAFSWLAFSRFTLKRGQDELTIVHEMAPPVIKGGPGTDSGAWAEGIASLTLLEPRPAPDWVAERLQELAAAVPVRARQELA